MNLVINNYTAGNITYDSTTPSTTINALSSFTVTGDTNVLEISLDLEFWKDLIAERVSVGTVNIQYNGQHAVQLLRDIINNLSLKKILNGGATANKQDIANTSLTTLGSITDTASTGNGSIAAHLRRVRDLLTENTVGITTYVWQTPHSVGGVNKNHCDIFNATGSGVVLKIKGIYPVIKGDVGVSGALSLRMDLYRTSAVGTGGTEAVYKSATRDVAGGCIWPRDTSNANLPSQVTARHLLTGGGTVSEWLHRFECFPEEASPAMYFSAGQSNYAPIDNGTQCITLRENQGLLIRQGAVASVNNIAFRIVFTI